MEFMIYVRGEAWQAFVRQDAGIGGCRAGCVGLKSRGPFWACMFSSGQYVSAGEWAIAHNHSTIMEIIHFAFEGIEIGWACTICRSIEKKKNILQKRCYPSLS